MKIVFNSPRVENIPFIKKEFEKFDIIVLEEPKNDLFYDVLEGKLAPQAYARKIHTSYPLYTEKLMDMLRGMRRKQIFQVEPYLEEVERLRNFNEGDSRVKEMERRVNMHYVDFTESFLKADFEEIIEKTLKFSEADAERLKMRDEMRAKALEEFDNAIVEAGMDHFLLAELLNAEHVRIPEIIARTLGTEYLEIPGSRLLRAFIKGEEEDFRLLAARNLIFITLLEKREMVPDFEGDFPHFVHEQKLVRFVNKLDYEKCKKLFYKFWSPK